MNKLGIGYITCNAPERVEQTFKTIPNLGGELVVVNSGCILPDKTFEGATEIIQSGKKVSVANAKNKALRYLMNSGCDHLFLIEDDIIIKDPNVFGKYLKAAEASGIWHLNYALQGGFNRAQPVGTSIKTINDLNELIENSPPAPRYKLTYEDGIKLAFYPHAIGSFQYFYRGVIKNVGYFDERYENALEHIDLTYRIIQKGLHPPYWYFADLENSDEYLGNVENCMTDSELKRDKKYGDKLLFAKQWFKGKFDVAPELIPDTPEEIAIKKLNKIKENYARKVT